MMTLVYENRNESLKTIMEDMYFLFDKDTSNVAFKVQAQTNFTHLVCTTHFCSSFLF